MSGGYGPENLSIEFEGSNSIEKSIEAKQVQTDQPKTHDGVTLITFYLIGIIVLFPWMFLVTANDYWLFKFRGVQGTSSTNTSSINGLFTSTYSFSSALSIAVVYFLNALFFYRWGTFRQRMIYSLYTMLIFFVITLIFVDVNTDGWQTTFFGISVFNVVFLNLAVGVMESTLITVVGIFPPQYITAVSSGRSLVGILAAVAQIICLTGDFDPQTTALIYFVFGNLLIVLAIYCVYHLTRSEFFQFYMSEKDVVQTSPWTTTRITEVYRKRVFNKIWKYCVSAVLVNFTSFTIYPGITVLYKPQSIFKGGYRKYFVAVIIYLVYSVVDYFGRYISHYLQQPKSGTTHIVVNLLRLIFIPVFIICIFNPKEWPAVLKTDGCFIMLLIMFALTDGYVFNVTIIRTSSCVETFEREAATTILTGFLAIGFLTGTFVNLLITKYYYNTHIQ